MLEFMYLTLQGLYKKKVTQIAGIINNQMSILYIIWLLICNTQEASYCTGSEIDS